MTKIQRVTQKIFGDDAITQQFTQFGTAKTDNPVYTKDLESLQGGEFDGGWADAVQEDYAPYMEDMNGYMYMVTTQLAYILQQGAAIEWDDSTTYYTGSIVCAPDGSGTWYKSLIDNNTAALTETTAWARVELNKNGTPLFTQITTDYVLSGNDAIGWAIQGSQVQRSVYSDAYDKILSLYNAGTDVTYRGIAGKRSSDGRYIADIAQRTAINNLFNNTGVADFYILDQTTQSFYLPKTARFIQYTLDANKLNQYVDNGLPSLNQTITATTAETGNHNHDYGNIRITGTIKSTDTREALFYADGLTASGALYLDNKTTNFPAFPTSGTGTVHQALKIDTKRGGISGNTGTNGKHTHVVTVRNTIGNAVYGRSTIVQPPSSMRLLYYRVGDTAV